MHSLLLLVFGIIPHESIVQENFDRVEINHVYDEEGKWRYDQIMWYNWYPERCRFEVEAFRAIRSDNSMRGKRPEDIEAKKKWDQEQQALPEWKRIPYNPPYLGDAQITPKKDWNKNEYYSIFREPTYVTDRSILPIREVRAKTYVETWTQYDNEALARETLSIHDRKNLLVPLKDKELNGHQDN